jgi:hypothetical protein
MAQKIGAIGLYLLVMIFGIMEIASLHTDGIISNLWSNIWCCVVGFVSMFMLRMALDTKP